MGVVAHFKGIKRKLPDLRRSSQRRHHKVARGVSSLVIEIAEPSAIFQRYLTRGRNLDERLTFQVRERPGHGFDGKSQIVGDVLA